MIEHYWFLAPTKEALNIDQKIREMVLKHSICDVEKAESLEEVEIMFKLKNYKKGRLIYD